MKARRHSHILIIGQNRGLPYSKGLMATSITAAGLNPAQAYEAAERIEGILTDRRLAQISNGDLRDITASVLAGIDPRYAARYLKWQAVEQLDMPLVVMVGGATGVGKSTVATQLAARLGITRVISTDAIREVLRAAFSQELMPALYVSSFEADEALRVAVPAGVDQLIVGFQEQVLAVSVGIKALIARALEEGTDIIVEGAHVVPGFLEGWDEEFPDAVLVPVVITLSSELLHRSNFQRRAYETGAQRPRDRYLSRFDKIRAIQSYITHLAVERGVPVLEMSDLDSTLQEIAGIVVARALEKAEARGEIESTIPPSFELTEEGEVVARHEVAARKPKVSRLRSWEILGSKRR